MGFFFISTPFLLLFKTNQVITPRPPFLLNYEEVIARNAQVIYSNILFDEMILLRPAKLDDQSNDIQNRFWRYFNSNSHKIVFDTNIETMKTVDLAAKEISQQKSIFLAPFVVAYPMMQAFCSFSNFPDLYRMFHFHDASQREILTGPAVRKGFEDSKLLKRIRNAMEFHLYQQLPFTTSNFGGFTHKVDPVINHRLSQLSYCQETKILGQQLHSPKASDLHFFLYFLKIVALFLALAFIVLVTEVCRNH